MNQHEKINYVEFPSKNLSLTKEFFSTVFGFKFTDYGPEYSAFSNAGIEGGFYLADRSCRANEGSALIVFYSEELEQTEQKVIHAGGTIVTPTFSFPGGRRFHFCDPNGNEYAVWTKSNTVTPDREKQTV